MTILIDRASLRAERRLVVAASASLSALFLAAAFNAHLLCGLFCLHGHGERLVPGEICQASAPAR